VFGALAQLLEDRTAKHMVPAFALRPLVEQNAEQEEHVLRVGFSHLMNEVVHLWRTGPRCSAKVAM
jgi:hypothetical protein